MWKVSVVSLVAYDKVWEERDEPNKELFSLQDDFRVTLEKPGLNGLEIKTTS